jgi:hypothetical protein
MEDGSPDVPLALAGLAVAQKQHQAKHTPWDQARAGTPRAGRWRIIEVGASGRHATVIGRVSSEVYHPLP